MFTEVAQTDFGPVERFLLFALKVWVCVDFQCLNKLFSQLSAGVLNYLFRNPLYFKILCLRSFCFELDESN